MEQPLFGRRLRALRQERGLSQGALAADVISTGYLSRLESGARQPTPRVVKYLAKRLDVPVSAFETAGAPSLARALAAVTSAGAGDGAETLVEALRTDDGRVPELRWQALWLLARMRGEQGAHAEQLTLLTELAELTDELAAPDLRARVCTQLARCVRVLGDVARAREYAAQAVELSEQAAVADRAAALHALVSAEAEAGRVAEARSHADELCALTRDAGAPAHTEALWALATVCIRQGAFGDARQALELALDRLDSHQDLALWMRLRLAAASLYLQSTPPLVEPAAARLAEVEPVLALVGTELNRQEATALRAHLAFAEGRFDDARKLCAAVEPERLSFRDRIRLEALGSQLMIMEGKAEAGFQRLHQLAQAASDARNVELAAEIWRGLAETLAGQGGKAG
ncbi:MAG TPA: helix-turn-helix transcriptional regulator [Micromonosporaceae bacterium]|nr:helix-turn-helix transcriptional regulator [Micromonosporaceae bacterium]